MRVVVQYRMEEVVHLSPFHASAPSPSSTTGRDLDPSHMEAQADGDRRKPSDRGDDTARHDLTAMQVFPMGKPAHQPANLASPPHPIPRPMIIRVPIPTPTPILYQNCTHFHPNHVLLTMPILIHV